MKTMCEMLETRRLMSSTTELVTQAAEPETIALLLPAVQAAREAARSSAGSPGGGPVVQVFSGNAGGAAANGHTGGVNASFCDRSVRFVSSGIGLAL